MDDLLRPLRIRMAMLGFLAMYAPALLLLGAAALSQQNEDVDSSFEPDAQFQEELVIVERSIDWLPVLVAGLLLMLPVAWVAWRLAGRALRPVRDAMEVQQNLVAETSHELRTPLSILTNNAEVLLAHNEPSVDLYRRGLERSLNTAQSMTHTVESLLVDARANAIGAVRQPADLGNLARQVIAELGPLAKDSAVTLQGNFDEAAVAVIDEPSVRRSIANLVTNAIAAAPANTTVAVATATSDGFAHVSVTDSGPGIEPENQENVFNRFWKDGSHGGTGLGLPIAQQVAQAHGGDVTLESPLPHGSGCCFTLSVAA